MCTVQCYTEIIFFNKTTCSNYSFLIDTIILFDKISLACYLLKVHLEKKFQTTSIEMTEYFEIVHSFVQLTFCLRWWQRSLVDLFSWLIWGKFSLRILQRLCWQCPSRNKLQLSNSLVEVFSGLTHNVNIKINLKVCIHWDWSRSFNLEGDAPPYKKSKAAACQQWCHKTSLSASRSREDSLIS